MISEIDSEDMLRYINYGTKIKQICLCNFLEIKQGRQPGHRSGASDDGFQWAINLES